MTDRELWKDIPEFPEYQISSHGRVYSDVSGRYRKLTNHTSGYLSLTFKYRGLVKTKFIHRLVAEAFCPNPFSLPTVNHIDGNKKNNYYNNLEWASYQENIQHAYDTGLNKGRPKQAIQVVETGQIFNSQLACARELGVSRRRISDVLGYATRTCRGMHLVEVAQE